VHCGDCSKSGVLVFVCIFNLLGRINYRLLNAGQDFGNHYAINATRCRHYQHRSEVEPDRASCEALRCWNDGEPQLRADAGDQAPGSFAFVRLRFVPVVRARWRAGFFVSAAAVSSDVAAELAVSAAGVAPSEVPFGEGA